MKTLYLECNMGAAGDMLMAALYELLEDKQGFLDTKNSLGLPGVRLEGPVQVLLVVQNGLFQPVQGLDAGLDREGPAGEKVGSLLFQQGLNRLFGGHGAPPSNSFPSILPQMKQKVKKNSAETAVQ